jgi:hypothetical protein
VVRRKDSALRHALPRTVQLLTCLVAALLPATVSAYDISGFMEYDFGASHVKSTSPSGVSTSSSSQLFLQRYNLDVRENLYPKLSLDAGGMFGNDVSNNSSAGTNSVSSTTQLSPFATLGWRDETFPVNLGYQRRESRSSSNGAAAPTQILESYNASLGWRPLELPAWSFMYLRTNQFDNLGQQDLSTDSLQWGTRYDQLVGMAFSYQGSYLRSTDHVRGGETDNLSQSGRASYAGQFFNNRLSVASSYNLAISTNSFTSAAAGGVMPVLALNGSLFGVTSPTSPVRVDSGQLSASASIFNVNIITAQAPLPGTQDNFGLDFARPVRVEMLYLPVVSGTNTLPPRIVDLNLIAGLFQWSIYTSDDGIAWTISQTVTPSFGDDPSHAGTTVGFILNLTPVTKRYLKAVVVPVQSSALLPFLPIANLDPGNLTITGLQAFAAVGSQGTSTTSAVGGIYNLSASARLLDNPNLNYDLSFSLNHNSNDQSSSLSYYLSNGLSTSRRFNDVFFGTARVSLNNSKTQGSLYTTNTASASAALTAVPLPTLSHTLVYSGSFGWTGSQKVIGNSIFLNNTLQLYRGAALLLSGGFASNTDGTGRASDSSIINAGISLTPLKSVTIDASYGQTDSKASGGGLPDTTSQVRIVTSTLTYRPFEVLYFTGRWTLFEQLNQPDFTTQTYGFTWSPFPGGALQLTVNYNEDLSLPQDARTRGASCSLQWIIRSGIMLDAGYSYARITSPGTGSTDVNGFSTVLRIAL